MENNKRKNKGITLVVLVVTIIILLILAGISISTLNGENGLFSKVKESREKYSIAESKEKIELEITNLQTEKQGKGEELKKEDLPEMNNDEIDVRDTTNFPVEVICNGYKFNIDSSFNVLYIGIANETIITYTTEPKGYTNQNSVKVTVKITSPKGIKSILKPGETDKILPQGKTEVGIDFYVTENGKYTIKIVDNENKEITKDIEINSIDRLPPKDFAVSSGDITSKSISVNVNAEDSEETSENVKSGIERYEYFIKGPSNTEYKKYESTEKEFKYDNLLHNTSYYIYVIAYDKAGNYKETQKINVTTTETNYPTLTLNGMVEAEEPKAENAMYTETFDKDFSTYKEIPGIDIYFKIDKNCWNKYIAIQYESLKGGFIGTIGYYGSIGFGSSYNEASNIKSGWLNDLSGLTNGGKLITKCVYIPNGSNWGILNSGTGHGADFFVYEIWCSDKNLTGNKYSNDNLPLNF